MSTEEQRSTDIAFDGKIVRVRVDAVGLPGGRESTREVVEHAASVVIVPVDADGNVLLVRQFRYPVGHSLLEAPAGGVETGESPDDSAQRELQEETGYASRGLLALGGFWMSPGYCTEYMHAYLARELVPSQLNPDEDEDITVERVPIDRIKKLVRWGEIKDAKTVAALYMAMPMLDR